ncbi:MULTISPECIES: FliH/SctL family protein [Clostridium]|uniref:FliH/SctL family protein n=1 Tax=Clostridium TaxID=1485 RepID=UPI00082478FE|nr:MULTISPECIES: FliH/SctL family protein [Clostridium]PJI09867.1 flagellar assembly protein FliH [Clostridium sp. CT7]
MLLSSNIIDYERILDKNKEHVIPVAEVKSFEEYKKLAGDSEQAEIEQYTAIADAILSKAKAEAEEIKNKGIEESRDAYKKAYDEAYEKGLSEGRKKGHDDAYNDTFVKGNMEIENLKSLAQQNASNIIKSAKYEVEEYFKSKEKEIKKLALEMAQHVLKERVSESDGLNNMIYEAINLSKNTKTIIIKCNKKHSESVKAALKDWKRTLPYHGEFFVIDDGYVEEDSAIVERDNGKVKVSIKGALQNIKEVLFKTE